MGKELLTGGPGRKRNDGLDHIRRLR